MHLERLYRLSRFHSLAAMTYTALESAWEETPPDGFIPAEWKEARDAAIRNSLLFAAERRQLEAFCEDKGIWYLPLKGILLQHDYPGIGLREMADNDILFDAAFQQEIHDWFVKRGYTVACYKSGVHDTYHKAPVLNFEMHTTLFSPAVHPDWADYFKEAITRLQPIEGTCQGRQFRPEDVYLYLLAHMYKHFEGESVGIRALLDVYFFLQNHRTELDQELLGEGLRRLDLEEFHRQISKLADTVFAEESTLQKESVQAMMRTLAAGTYGTKIQLLQDRVYTFAGKEKAITPYMKFRFSMWRLFPDRKVMEKWCRGNAPLLGRYPRLMFVACGYRLAQKLVQGRAKNFLREQRFLWTQWKTSPSGRNSCGADANMVS